MERDWTDEQIKEVRGQLSQARRHGLWISALQVEMFLRLLHWWQRSSVTGWRRPHQGNIVSIGALRAQGVTAIVVSCGRNCARTDRRIEIADLHMPPGRRPLPDHAAFLDIPNLCRFRCVTCGSRQVRIMPSWPAGSSMGGAHGQSSGMPLTETKKRWSEDE